MLTMAFGCLFYYMLSMAIIFFFKATGTEKLIAALLLGTFAASYLIPIMANFTRIKFWNYLVGTFAILFLTPTYFNLFTIYAIANLHDISWGNREGGDAQGEQKKVKLDSFRAWWFVIWLLANGVYAYVIVLFTQTVPNGNGAAEVGAKVVLGVSLLVTGIVALKIILGAFYSAYYCLCCRLRISRRRK